MITVERANALVALGFVGFVVFIAVDQFKKYRWKKKIRDES